MASTILKQLGLGHLSPRQTALQILNFALILSTAFMLWKSLSVVTNSPSPIVVVLSGSMEPAFQRGDLLFLWNRGGLGDEIPVAQVGDGNEGREKSWSEAILGGTRRTRVGEIVVYNVRGKDIPIVHRVVRTFPQYDSKTGNFSTLLLTKGDNNIADDTELYARDQDYLDRDKDIIGSVRGYVPAVGYVTILLSEHPWLKSVMLGLMGVMVVLQRE